MVSKQHLENLESQITASKEHLSKLETKIVKLSHDAKSLRTYLEEYGRQFEIHM